MEIYMKEKWYKSSVTKAVLIVVVHVLVIVITASFMWLLSYPVLRAEIFAGRSAKEYKDSRNFIDKMLQYSQQAVSGIKSADLFETEGKYNPDKIVDIEKYYKTHFRHALLALSGTARKLVPAVAASPGFDTRPS